MGGWSYSLGLQEMLRTRSSFYLAQEKNARRSRLNALERKTRQAAHSWVRLHRATLDRGLFSEVHHSSEWVVRVELLSATLQ